MAGQEVKLRKVISKDNLPTKGPVILYGVVYHLLSKAYDWHMAVDIAFYVVLFLIFVAMIQKQAREVPVDILNK